MRSARADSCEETVTLNARRGRAPGVSWLWLVACVVAVLYGSWLPFRANFANFSAAADWPAIGFHPSDLNDAITNLLVYVPIGFLIVVCGRCARSTRVARIAPAAAFALLCGTLVESVQAAMPARVASWNDVRLNGVGAAVGAAVGALCAYVIPAAKHAWHRKFQAAPHATLAAMLAPALLLYGLFPFAPAVDAQALKSSFLNARWNPLSVHDLRLDAPPLAAIVEHVTDAAWIALLGYLAARGARAVGRSIPIAAQLCLVVIICREFLGVFVRHHVFDAGAMLLAGLGAALGIWTATCLLGTPDPLTRRSRAHARARCIAWSAVAGCQMAALIMAEFRPGFAVDMTTLMSRFESEPFAAYWRMPITAALMAGVPLLIKYAVLGLALAGALRRSGIWAYGTILALIATTALSVELLRAASGTSYGDLTNVLLAVGAALAGRSLHTALTVSSNHCADVGEHPVTNENVAACGPGA